MNRKTETAPLSFMKFHGLGNDFVVLDHRVGGADMTPVLACALGDRRRGVGFDQLAVMHCDDSADVSLTFYNADGSAVGACGNATRCIARFLMTESGHDAVSLRTERGILYARDAGGGMTAVNMGLPQLDWADVPLAHKMDTLYLPLDGAPSATGMGNPHCTFFVSDVDAVDLAAFGSVQEHHPLFPERTNVQLATVVGADRVRVRVWERGVGVTLASGSSSCAVAVAAARRGLTGRAVKIELDGGSLDIDWRDDGVWMTGSTAHVFSGQLTREFHEASL